MELSGSSYQTVGLVLQKGLVQAEDRLPGVALGPGEFNLPRTARAVPLDAMRTLETKEFSICAGRFRD